MTNRKMQQGLVHKHPSTKTAEFFNLIDQTGGWPVGYKFVGFEHSDERKAGFCNSPSNNGWWTVVASADDYYMWKLSPEALQRIVDGVLSASRVTLVNAQYLRIKNSQGDKAEIAQLPKGGAA